MHRWTGIPTIYIWLPLLRCVELKVRDETIYLGLYSHLVVGLVSSLCWWALSITRHQCKHLLWTQGSRRVNLQPHLLLPLSDHTSSTVVVFLEEVWERKKKKFAKRLNKKRLDLRIKEVPNKSILYLWLQRFSSINNYIVEKSGNPKHLSKLFLDLLVEDQVLLRKTALVQYILKLQLCCTLFTLSSLCSNLEIHCFQNMHEVHLSS